jgi:hypothetical protein
VTGGSLTADITATAPTGFQVSSDGTNYGSTATFTQTDGFASGSLFLRLASNALAGTYSNQVVALASGSASNSVAIATSTVNPYSITVGAVATNKVYGAADPAFTYTNAPLLFSDSLSGSLGRAAGENVGTYAINQGTLANPNYSISFTGANLTITAAALPNITWSGGSISNSNGVASFSYAYSGVSNNGISTTYSNSLAPTNAGYYTVVATSTDGNYSGSSTNTYFVAGPVAVSDAITKPAGNPNPSLVMTLASLLANDVRITPEGAVATDGLGLSITGVMNGSGNSAEIDGGDILFTPGGASPETFTYTLSYGDQEAIGTVTVTTETQAPTFTLEIVKVGTATFEGGNTTVTHDFIGVPNQTYLLEYKTNLQADWTSAGNRSTGTTGSFPVSFTKVGENVAADWNRGMFFRARLVR